MTKITINLTTGKYPGKGLGITFPVAVVLLSAILFFYLVIKTEEYNDAIERVAKRVAELAERQIEKTGSVRGIDAAEADLAVVAEIAGKKGFSWIRALDNIEKAIPAGISLSSIQPSFMEEGGVKLSGYAKDFAALSRFIDRLEGLKVYKRVFLINHSLKEMEDERKAVLFNISIEGGR